MQDEKNKIMAEELDLDDLEQVSGGTMQDIRKKPTTDISKDTLEQMNEK